MPPTAKPLDRATGHKAPGAQELQNGTSHSDQLQNEPWSDELKSNASEVMLVQAARQKSEEIAYQQPQRALIVSDSAPVEAGIKFDLEKPPKLYCLATLAGNNNEPPQAADDLDRVIKTVSGSGPASKIVRQNPLALMAMILAECGMTSESKRRDLDNYILSAEVQTRASSWEDPGKKLVRWPHDFYTVMSILHLCQNNLTFVNHAVEFEITAWEFLQKIALDKEVQKWLRASTGDGQWQAIRDDIDYELSHTSSRKAQIGCLRERVEVQIALIDNMVAHQETSQTSLIAILALVFAPASLISCGHISYGG
ncbi:hypothetical protein G7Z17_g2464 [Cylindrodendrum hubeiense]|uniref:Uncharacterized protein n=1 Tax=Cylindrodendrum hubeiense TaxID=595255 RepID=A0A9P5HN17_9HYPO|nr:hypothetical protein G7Z17_g2464 [Cylindrodendrum hubeiense]